MCDGAVMDEYLQAAAHIVRTAGLRAKSIIHEARILKTKSLGDIVTDGDLLVEDYVIASLSKRFPDHGFDSEERGKSGHQGEFIWVLDPLDGTKYYARDVPLYSVSLALKYRGTPIIGLVYSPELDRMYTARSGGGTTLNGRGVWCSKEECLDRAVVYLEIPNRESPPEEREWGMWAASMLVIATSRIRIIGVAALGLALCAGGGFDAYVNLNTGWKECDVAAGEVLIREGGGEWWEIGRRIVAGPGALCEQILARLGIEK